MDDSAVHGRDGRREPEPFSGAEARPQNGSGPVPENAAIVFENVCKRFPGAAQAAVDDVSLEVSHGHLVVLLGPSGCGKTTLLRMTNRLIERDSGRILIEGREVRDFQATELRRHMGYVIQSTGLFPHMTVAKNIATVPEMLGWEKARVRARVDELLELVGLPPGEYRSRYPSQLSGGQQQRVGLARAMAADPTIMLMDEPFAAIDNITRRRLQDELLDIQSKVHKTVLFVTHDVEEAIRLADELAVMREGKVVQYGTPLHILTRPADEFVARLVGAEDVLRRLGLLTVASVLTRLDGPRSAPLNGPGAPLKLQSTLREALGRLLTSTVDVLPVADNQGQVVGSITLQAIREATRGEDTGEGSHKHPTLPGARR